MKRPILWMVIGLMVVVLGHRVAHAASFVTLDPAFSFDGSDFKNGILGSINCVATIPDGKVVISGTSGVGVANANPQSVGSFVFRLNNDGSLDPTFASVFVQGVSCTDIAVSSTGKIAVAMTNGKTVLIPTGGGAAQILFSPTNLPGGAIDFSLSDLVFASDGSLIVLLHPHVGAKRYTVRYLPGGLDANYNGNNVYADLRSSPVMQLDAKDNVYGASGFGPFIFNNGVPPNWQIVISKLLANGLQDASFFPDNKNMLVTHTDYTSEKVADPPSYSLNDFVLQSDGKYFVAGLMEGCFAFSRVTADGELDASFGNAGTQQVCGKLPVGVASHFSIRQLSNGNTLVVFHYMASDTTMVLLFGADGKILNTYSTPTEPTIGVNPMAYKDKSPNSYLASFKNADNSVGLRRYLVDTSASSCPTGAESLIVEVGGTNLTATITSKCVKSTDPGVNYSCPSGQVLLSAQKCTTTPNINTPNMCPSGQYVQRVSKCVALNPELSDQCKSSGQNLIAAGGTCLAVSTISTYPDANGNCAKDEVSYSLNGVKLCAANAVMPNNASTGTSNASDARPDQSAQPFSGGGNCSLIR